MNLDQQGRGGAIVKEKPAAITAMQRNKRFRCKISPTMDQRKVSGTSSNQPCIKASDPEESPREKA